MTKIIKNFKKEIFSNKKMLKIKNILQKIKNQIISQKIFF